MVAQARQTLGDLGLRRIKQWISGSLAARREVSGTA
jgi:hypothetical protein